MKRMRILAVMMLICGAVAAGCTNPKNQTWPYVHDDTETLGETAGDHRHRTRKVADRDAKSLAEDWDIFMMTDRPSRLNRWQDE